MLTYNFDQVEGPVYDYLYRCIKQDIVSGNLQPGEKLPSKRSFAKNNGVSTITIQNAYDQLIGEGYVYTKPKKGYYVADMAGLMTASPAAAGLSASIELPQSRPHYDIDLSGNHTDPENFPFSVWAKMCREIISGKSRELMEISPAGGSPAVRRAIATHLRSFRGMVVDPDQIVIGAGTEYLYGLLIQLIGQDKAFATENPGYRKPVQIYAQHHVECHFVDMDQQGISIEGLRNSGAEVAHISPNHHFPTGITMPASRRYEVLAWANEKAGRYIIEDDYDSEFRPNGRPIPTLFSIDGSEKVIYMNTFSKSLSPTIRISYMALPLPLANQFYRQLSFYSCTVSNFEQYVLEAFISQGHFEKHINRMRLYYSRQRKKVIDCIEKSPLQENCSIIENDAGLHFLLALRTEKSDQQLLEDLAKRGIHIKALSEYDLRSGNEEREDKAGKGDREKEGEDHLFIINYSNIDVEKLEKALQVINECL